MDVTVTLKAFSRRSKCTPLDSPDAHVDPFIGSLPEIKVAFSMIYHRIIIIIIINDDIFFVDGPDYLMVMSA